MRAREKLEIAMVKIRSLEQALSDLDTFEKDGKEWNRVRAARIAQAAVRLSDLIADARKHDGGMGLTFQVSGIMAEDDDTVHLTGDDEYLKLEGTLVDIESITFNRYYYDDV
jgi:hypothetical protein